MLVCKCLRVSVHVSVIHVHVSEGPFKSYVTLFSGN